MRIMFSDPAIYQGRKAVFLDRDGVINQRIVGSYVCRWQDFTFSPDALRAIKLLSDINLPIIVVSNQAGVAKGLVKIDDLCELTIAFHDAVAKSGGRIDGVYYCVHHPDEQCECRKPRPGMLLQAASEWNLDLSECFMVGDAETDIIAGSSVGCKTILVDNRAELPENIKECGCVAVKDLSAATEMLTNEIGRAKVPVHTKDYSVFAFEGRNERVPG
jgi:D-glycero-D-manno-heptose 1,7-bisphosphate phosphatase